MRTHQVRFAVLLGIVVAFTGYLAVIASITGFTLSDFQSFIDAQELGLSIGFLTEPVFGHFVPGHRLLNWAVLSVAPLNLTVTSGFLAGVFALTVLAMHRLLADLVRPGALALALTAYFAASSIQVGTSFWWAAALSRMPTNLFGILAVVGYLRYRRDDRPVWLFASAGSLGMGLAFAEDAMLVLGVIVGLRVLVLEPHRPLAETLRAVVAEWRTWVVYLVPIAVSLLGSTSQTTSLYTFQTPALLVEYLATGWFRLFVPALVGQYVDVGPLSGYELAMALVSQVALVAAVVLTVRRRRAAWRSWAFFAFGFLLTQSPIGILRTGGFETALVAQQYRYYSLTIVIFTVALATAIRPLGGSDPKDAIQGPGPPTRAAPWPWRAGVVAFACIYVVGSLLSSYRAADAWAGRQSKPYLENLRTDLASLERSSSDFALLDAAVPPFVIEQIFFPRNRLSAITPLLSRDLDYATEGPGLHRARDDGHLEEVTVTTRGGGRARSLAASGRLVSLPLPLDTTSGRACIDHDEASAVSFTPAQPLDTRTWYLRLVYDSSGETALALAVDHGEGFVPAPESAQLVSPGQGELFTPLGRAPLHSIVMVVPPDVRLCLERLQIDAVERR